MAMTLTQFALHYVQVYAATVGRGVYHATIGPLIHPRRSLRFFWGVLDGVDVRNPDPVLGSRSVTDLLPPGAEPPDIDIRGSYYRVESSDTRQLLELSSLAYLIRATRPRRIFEFGTFIGRMTRHFALNAGPEAEVITLDLPRDQVSHDIGVSYRGAPEAARIRQLHGDSRTLDVTPWADTVDFCWVDACHDYPFVIADTRSAFRMVRVGGWIGWHDYRHTAWWSGVTRGVREASRRIGGGIRHLMGTTTALLSVTSDAKARMAEPG
jgi:predicted O-methyltransferase YrrM